ncbi:MAG: class I SAM-dependent methyltransferase [bacterium]|nr:class I SAM-dependent methyltransferase [bacterium]
MKLQTIQLPFFFGVQPNELNGGKPQIMPFKYGFNTQLKLYYQESYADLNEVLKKVYEEGSMLNGEMDFSDGGHQGKAAMDFILKNISSAKFRSVLEIGCGNGFLLKELYKHGFDCVGLEPGPQVDELKNEFNKIKIIKDFFPSKSIQQKFDVIIHYNVIEHIQNPKEFLLEQKKYLNDGGKIIFGMPNCEPNLKNGDISIFMHEHFNYFTRESLVLLANSIKMEVEHIEFAANDGMIFCSFINKYNIPNSIEYWLKYNWDEFPLKIENSLSILNTEISKFEEQDVAIYCPKRALNALSIINKLSCRLVDDTPSMYNNYLPSLQKKIENFNDLIKMPPKLIIIFSRTFGKEILIKCNSNEALSNTRILNIENFDQL